MALPALKLVQPHLRRGAVVIVDNTISSKDRYRDLLAYTREPASGFDTVTLPYSGGLDMIVYNPQAE
jgi:predicted O-methyltransferase YrrM